MPVLKLGRKGLAQIRPVAAPTYFYDSEIKGFGLRVMPSGVRTFIVEYRAGGGGRKAAVRRVSLGRADILTPEKARDQARKMLASVRLGEDPAGARSESRKAGTVSELYERYQAETGANLRDSTRQLYRMYWRLHILPEFGATKARDVTHSAIAKLHRRIGEASPATANRVLIQLSGFFRWAIRVKEFAGTNPVRDIEKFEETARERFLSTDELARLGAAIHEAETVGIPWEPDPAKKTKHAPKERLAKIDQFTAAALRMYLFTGARLREILGARRSKVDWERGLLFIDQSKTGKKTIVLNAPALTVLSSLPDTGDFLFPGVASSTPKIWRTKGAEEKPRTSVKRAWDTVRRRAGLSDVRIHDLRHTFAGVGVGHSIGLPIVGKLLGHAHISSTQRYAHLEADPVRRAADAIGATIETALNKGRQQ